MFDEVFVTQPLPLGQPDAWNGIERNSTSSTLPSYFDSKQSMFMNFIETVTKELFRFLYRHIRFFLSRYSIHSLCRMS